MRFAARNNRKGYSLVGVLLTLGVMGTIASGTAQLIQYQVVEQSTTRFHKQSQNILGDMSNSLLSNTACVNTLNGLILNAGTNAQVNNLRDDSNSPLFTRGEAYSDRSTRFERATAGNYSALSATQGELDLQIEFRNVARVHGSGRWTRPIRIETVRDAGTGVLVSCQAKNSGGGGTWTESGPGSSYTAGPLGIGGPATEPGLQVQGGFIHGQLECRRVDGPSAPGQARATCDADEWAFSGGSTCADPAVMYPEGGSVIESRPYVDGGEFRGWQGTCSRVDRGVGSGIPTAMSFAICCKK